MGILHAAFLFQMTLEGVQFVKKQDIELDFVEFLALLPIHP